MTPTATSPFEPAPVSSSRRPRSSNVERLRILAMFAIMGLHYSVRSGGLQSALASNRLFSVLLGTLGRTSVDVFVVIGAWFLLDSPFRFDRVFRIWLAVLVYTVPLHIWSLREMGTSGQGLFTELSDCLPLSGAPLWFPATYIGLLMLSPFLNRVVDALDRRTYRSMLAVVLLGICVVPTILPTFHRFYSDLTWFVSLYLVVGYLKRHSSRLFESRRRNVLVVLAGTVILFASYLLLDRIGASIKGLASMGITGDYYRGHLECLPDLVLSLSLFFLFLRLPVRPSRLFNSVAASTFGVYVIHETRCFGTSSGEGSSGRGISSTSRSSPSGRSSRSWSSSSPAWPSTSWRARS